MGLPVKLQAKLRLSWVGESAFHRFFTTHGTPLPRSRSRLPWEVAGGRPRRHPIGEAFGPHLQVVVSTRTSQKLETSSDGRRAVQTGDRLMRWHRDQPPSSIVHSASLVQPSRISTEHHDIKARPDHVLLLAGGGPIRILGPAKWSTPAGCSFPVALLVTDCARSLSAQVIDG